MSKEYEYTTEIDFMGDELSVKITYDYHEAEKPSDYEQGRPLYPGCPAEVTLNNVEVVDTQYSFKRLKGRDRDVYEGILNASVIEQCEEAMILIAEEEINHAKEI